MDKWISYFLKMCIFVEIIIEWKQKKGLSILYPNPISDMFSKVFPSIYLTI